MKIWCHKLSLLSKDIKVHDGSSCTLHFETLITSFISSITETAAKLAQKPEMTMYNLCSICSVLSFTSPHQRPSSALPLALSSPVEGSLVHFVSHPFPSPAPLFLSDSAWHPPQLVFSHTFHTGWHLGGSKGERLDMQGLWEEDNMSQRSVCLSFIMSRSAREEDDTISTSHRKPQHDHLTYFIIQTELSERKTM